MGNNIPRVHRNGISLPELVGLIACLGVGLIAGCWLFLKDSAHDVDRPSEASTPAAGVVAATTEESIKAPALSKEEAELRAIQQKIINDINAAQASLPTAEDVKELEIDPANPTIDQANVRALLGDNKPTRPSVAKASAGKSQQKSANTSTESNGPQTLAFWNAMNNVMAEEEAMRSAPAGGVTKENAADFIDRRGKAGNYAATELRGLDRAGVDPEVVALGTEIATWYERGAQLNDRANYLMNQASDETRRGQTGKNWGDAEKSHNASVADINRRGDILRMNMQQKYGLKFPDLR